MLTGEFQDLAGETLLEFNVDTCMALGGVHALGVLKQKLIKQHCHAVYPDDGSDQAVRSS